MRIPIPAIVVPVIVLLLYFFVPGLKERPWTVLRILGAIIAVIGDGVDANIYDNSTRLLYVSTREGIVHIFHEDSPDKFREVETVKTEFGAKTMALDPKTHNLYLTTANFGPPPAPTAEEPRPNPVPIPGTFRLLIYGH